MSTFMEMVAPFAISAGKSLNMDPAIIMAQWGYETGGGTNTGTKYNNLAGIKFNKNSVAGAYQPKDSIHAGYNSLASFTQDYIRVMNLSYYKGIRAAAAPGADPLKAKQAIDASPYAEADYSSSGFISWYNTAQKTLGGKTYTAADLTEKKTPYCLCKDCRLMGCLKWSGNTGCR